MSRTYQPEQERCDFFLFIDEFHNFATDSFASILSEARKYRLNLTLSHQYIAQLPLPIREAELLFVCSQAELGNKGPITSSPATRFARRRR